MGIGRHGGGRDGRHAADTGTSGGRTLLRVLALAVVCVVSGIVGGLVADSVRLQTPAPSSVASGESPVDGDSGGATTYTLSLPDVAYSSILGVQNQTHMERAKWSGSMPTSGEARILVVRVGFPDILYENGTPFHDGDTTEGISDFIGRHLDGSITCGDPGEYRDAYPYESLYAYYLRSSYGRLRMAGEAYEYVAKRERDEYTSDLESLFAEVLTALGDEIDYADYDGNGDGTLDCVCIRFAGDTTGWATEWWPHVFEASGEMSKPSFELDGKSLGSLVMLSYPASGMLEGRTLIHEVGHTMGLPDYYSSPYEMAEAKADGEEYAGIGTFEMMGANIGDLCGFSK